MNLKGMKPKGMQLKGIKAFQKSLQKFDDQLEKNNAPALARCGLFLQRQSMLQVPVDTSALKNGAFTRSKGKGWKAEVMVGYVAEYAVYVHEVMGAYHPIGKAKYLEDPAKDPDNLKRIRQIYQQRMAG
jgi:hypothetical protein